MSTPRVFIIRHGETEWSLSGQHTSTTDIPLTANGQKRILATGHALVGPDRLITPEKLAHIYVSPRSRAGSTLQLLLANTSLKTCSASTTITPDLEEWNYGEYEGMKSVDIRAKRREQGLDTDEHSWDIWTDGCPGGESPAEVEERCDRLIKEIREKWHAPVLEGKEGKGDVLLVAHGHLLRAFAMRWVGKKLAEKLTMLLEAGGVGTLSYEHHNVGEPAILLGGAFVVEAVQKAEEEQRRRVNARFGADVPVS